MAGSFASLLNDTTFNPTTGVQDVFPIYYVGPLNGSAAAII